MAYIQHSDGYSIKCDRCGYELHKENETKPYIHTDITELIKLAKEYGWSFRPHKIICTYCKTF
uniref:Uncharacterized protein n=1 Tax=Geladintestivirus 3 TaxID=3233135 RepID=A0AAU8MKH2_9CAUD